MQKNTIKNINLYQTNCKFNKNLALIDSEKFQIFMIPENYSIHKYTMTNKYINASSSFIFNASIINDEIYQFISAVHNKLNIYIFLDKILPNINNLNIKYIEYFPYLINKQLYIKNNIDKNNRIVYFHDESSSSLHPKLESLLYPNTRLNINIFDAHNIKHPLSLGFLNEIDKKNMLYDSKYYIHDNNNYYVAEALAAGCVCLNLDCEEPIESQLNHQYNTEYYLDIEKQTKDYCDYIEGIIYG